MDNVRNHYNRLAPYEWDRLLQDPYHTLEFRATTAAIEQHFPPTGRILDAGGGPDATNALKDHNDGRWERWLEILDTTSRHPAVVATSEHFLYIGRRLGRNQLEPVVSK